MKRVRSSVSSSVFIFVSLALILDVVYMFVCVHACVHECVCVCVCECVCVCVCVCSRIHMCKVMMINVNLCHTQHSISSTPRVINNIICRLCQRPTDDF